MWKCKKCGDYKFSTDSKCYCESFNIINEEGEECEAIYATSAEVAALKYAEESNVNGDYYLMNDSVIIKVNGKEFEISAEPDIYYSADEI